MLLTTTLGGRATGSRKNDRRGGTVASAAEGVVGGGKTVFVRGKKCNFDGWRGPGGSEGVHGDGAEARGRLSSSFRKLPRTSASRKLSVLVSERTTCLQGGTTFLRVFLLFRHGVFNTKTFTFIRRRRRGRDILQRLCVRSAAGRVKPT